MVRPVRHCSLVAGRNGDAKGSWIPSEEYKLGFQVFRYNERGRTFVELSEGEVRIILSGGQFNLGSPD